MNIFERIQERIEDLNKSGLDEERIEQNGALLASIRRLQIKFKEERCPVCEHYDSIKRDFLEKGNCVDKEGCFYGGTSDILGRDYF